MFNEDSNMRDLPAGGSEIPAVSNPQQGVRQVTAGEAQEQAQTAQKSAGIAALPWWDEMKYYWRRSKSGGFHLAPQDSYVDDVLHRADYFMASHATHELSDTDFEEFEQAAQAYISIIQDEDARDTAGTAGHAVRRFLLGRLVIARKITGSMQVSAEHRVEHETNSPTGDVEALKNDPKGYYQSDIDKRNRWVDEACKREYIVKAVADGEVIPTDPKLFAELVAKRVKSSIYDDAVEKGRGYLYPATQKQETNRELTLEEKLALTA